jgi:3-oxoacyl-[acyl-carrier-protein] synthase-3
MTAAATAEHLPRSARVTGWGMYAPQAVLTNAVLESLVDTSDEWIRTRTGIGERRIAAPWESTASLAAVAGRRAIAVAGLDPDEIDMVIVATCTPDYQMPATAALVTEALGTRRAAAMDVGAVCSGFIYALATAHAYVMSGLARHVVVIGAEVMSRILDFGDRNTCVLFGDGAGAVVVSASDEPGGGLLGVELTADASGAYRIWVPSGGSRDPRHVGSRFIYMDGRETYRYATRTLASSALAALRKAGLTTDDLALVVPHQANLRIIEAVTKQLAIPMERVFINLDRYGNTSAASVPLALAEAVDGGRVRPGDRLEMVAFGSGYTSGAVVLEWTADPAAGVRAASVEPVALLSEPPNWPELDPTPAQLRRLFEGFSAVRRPPLPAAEPAAVRAAVPAAVPPPAAAPSPAAVPGAIPAAVPPPAAAPAAAPPVLPAGTPVESPPPSSGPTSSSSPSPREVSP